MASKIVEKSKSSEEKAVEEKSAKSKVHLYTADECKRHFGKSKTVKYDFNIEEISPEIRSAKVAYHWVKSIVLVLFFTFLGYVIWILVSWLMNNFQFPDFSVPEP
ncbi:MAG: hypothetical protein ACTSUK_07745 [Promethearchaeota archaeon]